MTILAISQYEMECLSNWQVYEDKMVRLVEEAKIHQADLLVMGEYVGLELASWTEKNNQKQFAYIQTLLSRYQQFYLTLAQQYRLYIQPGTLPVLEKDGYYRNRAYFFSPHGEFAYQDKIYLTPFERQTRLLHPGNELKIFDTSLGRLGITICYDCEFSILAESLAHAGVQLLLVPSCTERISGLTRVSICAQARAIENQCYVAHASLIGKANWNNIVDINTGQSALYCPADSGFPETGILAQTALNIPMMIAVDLNWDKLTHVRQYGEMRNFQDRQIATSNLSFTLQMVKMT